MNESGVITQIYVENFVTYDKAVIKPGRYLNVIIGPNGTGKSTIVCAIVIGLAGKLSIIGRAKDVGDYVKTGKDLAKIEITLKLQDRLTKICRSFDRQSCTTWQIDGKSVGQKAVIEFIQKLNIQMDNLCQFLPQEKVQEFSNLSPERLLIETLRSASDPKMLEILAKLQELRNKQREIETIIQTKNNTLTQEQAKHDNLKDIVGNIKEKQKMQKKVKHLAQKKAWMLYDDRRNDLLKAKKKRDDCEKEIRKLEKEMKPIAEKIKKLVAAVDKLRSQDSLQLREITAKGNKVANLQNKITSLDEQVVDTEENWRQRVDTENRRDQEIQLTTQQIEKINNDLQNLIAEFGTAADIQAQENALSREIEAKRKESSTLSFQSNNLRQQDESLSREIQNQKNQMLRVENVKAKRLEVLRRRSEDAFKAVQWLERNRDKFSATVYDPMLLNINVSNKAYAKFVENVIPHRDLIAFVCEDKEDMNRLVQYLRRDQKLQINVLHSDPNKNVNMNPYIPLENIKQFGFERYLISVIDAPTTIMKYLVSMYHINNIPFGTSDYIDKNYSRVPKEISLFFGASNRYHVSVSKYSGAKSTSCDTINSMNMLNITIEADLINNIKNKLAGLEQQKLSIANDIRSLNERIDESNRATAELRETKNGLAKSLTALTNLTSKLQRMQTKLTELENEKKSIEEINEMFKKNIKDILLKSIDVYREINKMMEDIYKCSVVNEIGRLSLKIQQRKLANEKNESEDLRSRLETARRTYKELDGDLQPLKSAVERLLKAAKESTDGLTPSDPGFKELETAFNKLPPSLQEIDNTLSETRTRLCCMGTDNNGEQILESYDRTVKIIEETKALLQKKGDEKAKYAQRMTEMREKWYPEVQELVESINVNFSRYFSELKCSGELSLVHDSNIYDFDKYGLKIMVKFRDTDDLQELTRTHQSGGERALTTAVYMIALQNLSRVPFRCVDEINQGMDPINERRVFQLLVKITGTSNGSQYFFLTPKLLPGLQYPKNVTVHCVYNGPYVIPHTEFSISDYAKNIKQILYDREN